MHACDCGVDESYLCKTFQSSAFSTNTAHSSVTFGGPTIVQLVGMPTKAELECKLRELRRQLEEKEQTIQQLREQLTLQQTQLVDVQKECNEALEAVQQYEFTFTEMSRETNRRVFEEVEHVHQEVLAAHHREVQTQLVC